MNWVPFALLPLLLLLGAWLLKRQSRPVSAAGTRAVRVAIEAAHPQDADAWHISGIRTAEEFFREVPSLLPEATIVYLEGSPAEDVVEVLRLHDAHTSYGAPIGTIASWPRENERYALKASAQLFTSLAELGSRHAEPEMCSHLHFYKLTEPIATWFDAFSDPFIVSRSIPRARVERFCTALHATCTDAAV